MACRRWPMRCACSRTRPCTRRHHSGCALSAGGVSFSSPSVACRRSQEINEAAPNTPVFVLHLYDRAWLNAAALRAVGYTKDTPDPPGGMIERDRRGNPTGLLIAKPNANILYATLAKGPRLGPGDQANSTRHFMRELNRLGLTSIIDAGGGFQNYPDDYSVVDALHRSGQLTLRIAYNLFTQRPKQELADFQRWTSTATSVSGRRVVQIERRRRDAHLLRGRLRRLPRATARLAFRRWKRSSSRWFVTWRNMDGRFGCMRRTTSPSRASSTCSSVCIGTCHSTSCDGSSITPRRLRRKTSNV